MNPMVVRRVAVGVVLVCSMLDAPATAATSSTKKRATTTTTKRKVVIRKPAVAPASARLTVSTTTVRPIPTTTVATNPPATAPAAIVLPDPTLAPSTSTSTTTTIANDFTVRLATPSKTVAPGETVSFVIIVEPKSPGRVVAATIIVTGLPPGVAAALEPNPVTTAGELRVSVPSSLATGFYDLRITANSAGLVRNATATLMVNGAAVTTSSPLTMTTSTTLPPGNPGFVLAIGSTPDRLRTGGTIAYPIVVSRGAAFTGAVTFSTASLPAGVWSGFSDNPATTTSTLWLSSTVALVPGTYTFSLVATSGTYTQLFPLVVVITA